MLPLSQHKCVLFQGVTEQPSVYVYVYVYIYIYMCICTCACACTCTCICIRIGICRCISTSTSIMAAELDPGFHACEDDLPLDRFVGHSST